MPELSLHPTLHKKWSFTVRISSVNVTKSAGNCGLILGEAVVSFKVEKQK